MLLPEVRGSLSPGAQYHSNNSLIGKKPSLDRILRGITNSTTNDTVSHHSSNVHRIYRKVFANNPSGIGDGLSRVSGLQSDLSLRGIQNGAGVPLKMRPANINVHRNNNAIGGTIIGNTSLNSDLDIQGRSVIGGGGLK